MMKHTLVAMGTLALAWVVLDPVPARAQECLEEIVALQNMLPQPPLDAPLTGPYDTQTVGAQLDQQPTPGSVAAAEGKTPQLSGAAAYLNKAQNLQAAGDKAGCMEAVKEARRLLEQQKKQ